MSNQYPVSSIPHSSVVLSQVSHQQGYAELSATSASSSRALGAQSIEQLVQNMRAMRALQSQQSQNSQQSQQSQQSQLSQPSQQVRPHVVSVNMNTLQNLQQLLPVSLTLSSSQSSILSPDNIQMLHTVQPSSQRPTILTDIHSSDKDSEASVMQLADAPANQILVCFQSDGSAFIGHPDDILEKVQSSRISLINENEVRQQSRVESSTILTNHSGGFVLRKINNSVDRSPEYSRVTLPPDFSTLVLKPDQILPRRLSSEVGKSISVMDSLEEFKHVERGNDKYDMSCDPGTPHLTLGEILLSQSQSADNEVTLHDSLSVVKPNVKFLSVAHDNNISNEKLLMCLPRSSVMTDSTIKLTSTEPNISTVQSGRTIVSEDFSHVSVLDKLLNMQSKLIAPVCRSTAEYTNVKQYQTPTTLPLLVSDFSYVDQSSVKDREMGEKREISTIEDLYRVIQSDTNQQVEPLYVFNPDLPQVLKQILPADESYSYTLKSFSMEEPSDNLSNMAAFHCVFSTSLHTGEEFIKWLRVFQSQNQTQFNIRGNKSCDGRYVIFKQYLKCHRNVQRGILGKHKHTGCPARMIVTIKPYPRKPRPLGSPPLQLCDIELTWNHNHSLNSVEVLKHQSVIPQTQHKLTELYRAGFTPRPAIECLRMDIEETLGEDENLEQVLANRALLPDYRHCHYHFRKVVGGSLLEDADEICEDSKQLVCDTETLVHRNTDSKVVRGKGKRKQKYKNKEEKSGELLNESMNVLSERLPQVSADVTATDVAATDAIVVNTGKPQIMSDSLINTSDTAHVTLQNNTARGACDVTSALVLKKMRDFLYDSSDIENFIRNVNKRAGETCMVGERYDVNRDCLVDSCSEQDDVSSEVETVDKGLKSGRVTHGEGNKYMVSVCLPMMRRVHEYIRESGETVFVETMGGFGREGHHVILLMSHSPAGGIGITPSDSSKALTTLFEQLKRVSPRCSFYRRGVRQGPATFITEDSSSAQEALRNVWPLSRQYTCQLTALRSIWKWLQLSTHGIQKKHRPLLYTIYKMLIMLDTEADLQHYYELLSEHTLVCQYPNFKSHIIDLHEKKRELLCSAYRHGTIYSARCATSGRPTGGYGETCMRIMKDFFFHRTRSFNLLQMLNFFKERFCGYYERRLFNLIAGVAPSLPVKFPSYSNQVIIQIMADIYEVSSDNEDGCVYHVNTSAVMCTCSEGGAGKACKHLHYVFSHITDHQVECRHLSDEYKLLFLVAAGHPTKTDDIAKEALALRQASIDKLNGKQSECSIIVKPNDDNYDCNEDNDDDDNEVMNVDERTCNKRNSSAVADKPLNTYHKKSRYSGQAERPVGHVADVKCEDVVNSNIESQIDEFSTTIKSKLMNMKESDQSSVSHALSLCIETMRKLSSAQDCVRALKAFSSINPSASLK